MVCGDLTMKSTSAGTAYQRRREHPLFVRVSHWINLIALVIMVTSGLRIYNASPIWEFTVPEAMTLGGWLAGARQWHFLGMWILAINGAAYVLYNMLTRHGRETTLFRRRDVGGLVPMILYYLRIRKGRPAQQKYNPLQKLAYSIVPLLGVGSIVSGIAIYWPVQFSGIAALLGGYESARVVHFFCSTGFILFTAGHLLMVAFAGWWNFLSMITGWKRVTTTTSRT
jgi:thiosulfate reductase cytochrome b subunit